MMITLILFLFPGIPWAFNYTIEGTYVYSSTNKTLTLTTDSSEFAEISGMKEEMEVLHFNLQYLILIDADDDNSAVFSFYRSYNSSPSIATRWDFSQGEIAYILDLKTDGSFTLNASSESDDNDNGDTDTEEEDDSPDNLCFISVLK